MFLNFAEGTDSAFATAVFESVSYYDRGVASSCAGDPIEAHKWFNLAAVTGDERGGAARADIAFGLTPREIAEAQRRARAYLREHHSH